MPDFKPYIVKTADRGKTWTSVSGNLPARSGAWSIVQDHVNPNLLFAGMEHGVWFTIDGGANWTQLKGGIPTVQARDLEIQKRANDLVVGRSDGSPTSRRLHALLAFTAQRSPEPTFSREGPYQFRNAHPFEPRWASKTPIAIWCDLHGNVGPAPSSVPAGADHTDDTVNIFSARRAEDAGVHRVALDLRGEPRRRRRTGLTRRRSSPLAFGGRRSAGPHRRRSVIAPRR